MDSFEGGKSASGADVDPRRDTTPEPLLTVLVKHDGVHAIAADGTVISLGAAHVEIALQRLRETLGGILSTPPEYLAPKLRYASALSPREAELYLNRADNRADVLADAAHLDLTGAGAALDPDVLSRIRSATP